MSRSIYENLFSEGILNSFEDFQMNKEHSGLDFKFPIFEKDFLNLIEESRNKNIKDHLSFDLLVNQIKENIDLNQKTILILKSRLIVPNLLKHLKPSNIRVYIIDFSEKEKEFLCFSCTGNHTSLKIQEIKNVEDNSIFIMFHDDIKNISTFGVDFTSFNNSILFEILVENLKIVSLQSLIYQNKIRNTNIYTNRKYEFNDLSQKWIDRMNQHISNEVILYSQLMKLDDNEIIFTDKELKKFGSFKKKNEQLKKSLFVTENIIQNKELIDILEKRFLIKIVERQKSSFSPVDIITSPNDCIIIFEIEFYEYYDFQIVEKLLENLILLSSQFDSCLVILEIILNENELSFKKDMDILSQLMTEFYSKIDKICLNIDIKFSFGIDMTCEFISNRYDTFGYKELNEMNEEIKKDEIILSLFPTINIFTSFLISQKYSFDQIMKFSLNELKKELNKILSEERIEIFYETLHLFSEIYDEPIMNSNIKEKSRDLSSLFHISDTPKKRSLSPKMIESPPKKKMSIEKKSSISPLKNGDIRDYFPIKSPKKNFINLENPRNSNTFSIPIFDKKSQPKKEVSPRDSFNISKIPLDFKKDLFGTKRVEKSPSVKRNIFDTPKTPSLQDPFIKTPKKRKDKDQYFEDAKYSKSPKTSHFKIRGPTKKK